MLVVVMCLAAAGIVVSALMIHAAGPAAPAEDDTLEGLRREVDGLRRAHAEFSEHIERRLAEAEASSAERDAQLRRNLEPARRLALVHGDRGGGAETA